MASKFLVSTLIEDTKIWDGDYGYLTGLDKTCLVLAQGRNAIIIDPTNFHTIATLRSDEQLTHSRIVFLNEEDSEIDSALKQKQKSDGIAGTNVIVTLSFSGQLNYWRFDASIGEYICHRLFDKSRAGQAPYHLCTLENASWITLTDSKGLFTSFHLGHRGKRVQNYIRFEKVQDTSMKTERLMLILGHDGNTEKTIVRVFNLASGEVIYAQQYRSKFNQIIPSVLGEYDMMIGQGGLVLFNHITEDSQQISNRTSFARASLLHQDRASLLHQDRASLLHQHTLVLLAEKNGTVTTGRISYIGNSPVIHFQQLVSVQRTPMLLLNMGAWIRLIVMETGDAEVYRVTSNDLMHTAEKIGSISNLTNIKDVCVIGNGRKRRLVCCSGEEEEGHLKVYSPEYRFTQAFGMGIQHIRKVFPIKTQVWNDYDNLVCVSNDEYSLLFNVTSAGFTPFGKSVFSSDPTTFVGNFHHQNCIVQVTRKGLFVIRRTAMSELELVNTIHSSIGEIEQAAADITTGTLLLSADDQLIRFTCTIEEDFPVVDEGVSVYLWFPISLISFMEQESSLYALIGYKNSCGITCVSVGTMQTIMSFDPPTSIPKSIFCTRDFFIVVDESGKRVKFFEYSVVNTYQGKFVCMQSGEADEEVSVGDSTAIESTSAADLFAQATSTIPQYYGETPLTSVSSVHLETLGKCLILVSECGLLVGKYNKSPEIISLYQTPIKVIYQETTNTITVITEQFDSALGMIHTLTIYTADDYSKVFSTSLPAGEKCVDLASGFFTNNAIEYFAMLSSIESAGKLHIFEFQPLSGSLHFRATDEFSLPPKEMQFNGGQLHVLLAGVNIQFSYQQGDLLEVERSLTSEDMCHLCFNMNKLIVSGSTHPLQIIGSDGNGAVPELAQAIASISDDMMGYVDADNNLNSFYLDDQIIGHGGPGSMHPRGRFWIGSEIKFMLTDRQLVFGEIVENNPQAFFVTASGSIGFVMKLTSKWSPVIRDFINAAREQEMSEPIAEKTRQMHSQRRDTDSDYIDGDVLRNIPSSYELIRKVLLKIPREFREKWSEDLCRDDAIAEIAYTLIELRSLLKPF